ncbi:hypothetical protein T4C_3538 [Trichinella pseudospiralis]|uniref:Uncharacterized protein n=1 Tax=Trichinella pseudospiralis TaxID=6337 RepID=A0A0V1IJA7_TRIPS|nr:hypothetical protein T4C_3538 [Trichinella pseudospiralis]
MFLLNHSNNFSTESSTFYEEKSCDLNNNCFGVSSSMFRIKYLSGFVTLSRRRQSPQHSQVFASSSRCLEKTGGPCIRLWCSIKWAIRSLVLKHHVKEKSIQDGPGRHANETMMLQVDEIRIPRQDLRSVVQGFELCGRFALRLRKLNQSCYCSEPAITRGSYSYQCSKGAVARKASGRFKSLPQFRRIYRNSWKHHQPQNQQRATVIASSPTVSSKTSTSRVTECNKDKITQKYFVTGAETWRK